MRLDEPWKLLNEQDDAGEDGGGGVATEDPPPPDTEGEETESPPETESEGEEAVAESEEQSLLDYIKEQGLDIDAPDDFAAAKALIERSQGAKGYQDKLAALERQREAELAYLREAQRQPAPVRKAPLDDLPETSRLKHWKNKPDFDPRWLSKLARDKDGNVVAAPGEDPQLPYKVRAYLDWKERAEQIQTDDPLGFFWDVATAHPEFTGAVNSMIQQQVAQAVANIKGEQLLDKSRGDLISDKNGELTPLGQAYAQAVNDFKNLGITDPQIVHPRAMAMAKGLVGVPSAAIPDSRAEKRFRWQKDQAARAQAAKPKPRKAKVSADPSDLRQAILDEFAEKGYAPENIVK